MRAGGTPPKAPAVPALRSVPALPARFPDPLGPSRGTSCLLHGAPARQSSCPLPRGPSVGGPALTVVQPAGEGERAVLDVEGEVVDVQAAGSHHLDGFEVLHLPVMADVNVGDVWGLSNIHTEGHEGQRCGLESTLGRGSFSRVAFQGRTAHEPGICLLFCFFGNTLAGISASHHLCTAQTAAFSQSPQEALEAP